MSFFLADTTGPLEEFASIGGYADFVDWVKDQSSDPLKHFIRDGFASEPEVLAQSLEDVAPTERVKEQYDVLKACALRAKDILILSDGMEEEETEKSLLRVAAGLQRTNEIHAVADKNEASLEVAIRFALATGRSKLSRKGIEHIVQTSQVPGDMIIEPVLSALRKSLEKVLPNTLSKISSQGAEAGLKRLPRQLRDAETFRASKEYGFGRISFDSITNAVVSWAEKYAAELIDQITESTREAINEAIVEALEGGSLEDLYDEIFAAVGDEKRAQLIAQTEVMKASNAGQQLAWDEARKKGLLDGSEKVTWIAADTGPCDECDALDGATRPLQGKYPNGEEGPPLHPRCRCTEGIVG